MSSGSQSEDRRLTILRSILGRHLTSRSRLDLLVFWGRYPCGWFDRRAVRPFTRSSREEIEAALDELVEEGVLRCRRDGAVPSYALTDAGAIRRAVQELPRLTRSERRYLFPPSAHQREGRREEYADKPSSRVLPQIAEGAEP